MDVLSNSSPVPNKDTDHAVEQVHEDGVTTNHQEPSSTGAPWSLYSETLPCPAPREGFSRRGHVADPSQLNAENLAHDYTAAAGAASTHQSDLPGPAGPMMGALQPGLQTPQTPQYHQTTPAGSHHLLPHHLTPPDSSSVSCDQANRVSPPRAVSTSDDLHGTPTPAQAPRTPSTFMLGQRIRVVHTQEPQNTSLLRRYKLGYMACSARNIAEAPRTKATVPRAGGKTEEIWRCAKAYCRSCDATGKGHTDLTARVAAAHHLTDVGGLQLRKYKRPDAKAGAAVGDEQAQMPYGQMPVQQSEIFPRRPAAYTAPHITGGDPFAFGDIPPENIPLARALYEQFTGLRQPQPYPPTPAAQVYDFADPTDEMGTEAGTMFFQETAAHAAVHGQAGGYDQSDTTEFANGYGQAVGYEQSKNTEFTNGYGQADGDGQVAWTGQAYDVPHSHGAGQTNPAMRPLHDQHDPIADQLDMQPSGQNEGASDAWMDELFGGGFA